MSMAEPFTAGSDPAAASPPESDAQPAEHAKPPADPPTTAAAEEHLEQVLDADRDRPPLFRTPDPQVTRSGGNPEGNA